LTDDDSVHKEILIMRGNMNMNEYRDELREILAEIEEIKKNNQLADDPSIKTLNDVANAMQDIKNDILMREVYNTARRVEKVERKLDAILRKLGGSDGQD